MVVAEFPLRLDVGGWFNFWLSLTVEVPEMSKRKNRIKH